MRVTTGMSQRHVLSDLRRVQERLATAQSQVSGGKRIEKPSDDPLGAERAMRLNDQLESTTAYRTAVDESRSWLDATDTALGSLGDIVQRVRELTLQAANGSTTPAGRQSIKLEVDQLTEQAKTTLNSAFDGRHLFSGTDDGHGALQRRHRRRLPGRQRGRGAPDRPRRERAGQRDRRRRALRPAAHPAHASPPTWPPTTSPRWGPPTYRRSTPAPTTLIAKQSQVGAITNRVDAAGQRLDDVYDVTNAFLSKTQDADLPQALTDLSAQQNALQAALRGGATLIQQSLMDFLR